MALHQKILKSYRKIQEAEICCQFRVFHYKTILFSLLVFSVALFKSNEALSLQNLPDINIGTRKQKKIIERQSSDLIPDRRGNSEQSPRSLGSTGSTAFGSWSASLPDGRPAFIDKFQIPNSVSSITREKIEEKINIIDSEDAVRYMPSLAVRKRYNGDTQAPLMTRTWGYNSPARSLVYVDDLLISNLISNETLTGSPRWGLVTPEEIERVDFLYGPYSAQYAGNSMGGVLQYTTRMPEKMVLSARNNIAVQDFSLYGTSRGFTTNVFNFYLGDRVNNFAWSLAGNWLRGSQIPQFYITTLPNNLYPYPGAYYAVNRFGLPATVIGAAGALTNDQVTAKLRATYDITRNIKASYTIGLWSNDGSSVPQNFTTPGYVPYFGRQPLPTPPWLGPSALLAFGSSYYRVQEKMLTNAGSIKSNSGGIFDFELSASNFSILKFDQVSPFSGAYPFGGYTSTGRDLRFGGTYWTLVDLKGIVRPDHESVKDHNISFGFHADQVHANNPVYLTANWPSGMSSSFGVVATNSSGTTRTQALWFQDAWELEENTKFIVGLRGENWKASDGITQGLSSITPTGLPGRPPLLTTLPTYQPVLTYARLSPKGSIEHKIDDKWAITGNIGMANRFPTVRELYGFNTAVTSGYDVNPSPNLLPEVALTKELVFTRTLFDGGSIRTSLFDEEVRDAIISQTIPVQGTTQLTLTARNVQRVRNSGVEVAINKSNFAVQGLELMTSATWVNSRIISYPGWTPSIGTPKTLSALLANPGNMDYWATSVSGKNMPYIPEWRGTLSATYRADQNWAFTVGARYQSKMWSTFTNNDYIQNVYQGLSGFFVVDTKVRYAHNDEFSFDFGIDNIGNYRYFLVNPMPQRTFYFTGNYQLGTASRGANSLFNKN